MVFHLIISKSEEAIDMAETERVRAKDLRVIHREEMSEIPENHP